MGSMTTPDVGDQHPADAVMPLAVIGVAGRFPGDATNPERLWDLLCEGRNALTEVPKDRYNVDGHYHPHSERQGSMNFRGANFLQGPLGAFDAPFFSFTSTEAKSLDPQQRLTLECAYEALENAGIPIANVAGTATSCYIGSFTGEYATMVGHDFENISSYHPTGTGAAALSNRVSWFYDLRGPSMTIDTACSSSLVALHLACQSLRCGEAKLALVGGTNFMCTPEYNVMMSTMHFLGSDSKCQTFDEKGNGYARGEGASFVVVKPLKDALRDRDNIRAVIRNTGTNQDGKTPGLTMPSAESQEDLIRKCYADAGLDLKDTGYFECHGTGTAAGDPIETSVLGATFGKARHRSEPLYIGSIKPNIGHLEGGSGLAGLTKAIYILEKGLIPKQIWFDKLNPRIKDDEWNLSIPTETMKWPYSGLRRASVNSFGFGGANAHCILDDAYHYLSSRCRQANHYTVIPSQSATASVCISRTSFSDDSAISMRPPLEAGEVGRKLQDPQFSISVQQSLEIMKLASTTPKILVWSSHEQAGLERTSQSLSSYLSSKNTGGEPEVESNLLENLAFTLASRRSRHAWKSFAVANSISGLQEVLQDVKTKPVRSSNAPRIGFVFTGQGAHHFAMGRELFAYEVFRLSLKAADQFLVSLGAEWSVIEELWRDQETSRLESPAFSQPICTALQVALVDLLAHWGIRPSAVVGHSSGEIGAAYAKGALDKQSAWLTSYQRGRLSEMIPELRPDLDGSMLAAGIGHDEAEDILKHITTGKASIACVNSPKSVTISGDTVAVDQVADILKDGGKFARKLKVRTAYHSFHVATIADAYLKSMKGMSPAQNQEGSPEMFSSVTGARVADNAELGPRYWVANLLQTVQFSDAVQALNSFTPTERTRRGQNKSFCDLLLEIGPSGALQGPLKQIFQEVGAKVNNFSVLARDKDCRQSILELIGRLFQEGVAVDFDKVNDTNEVPSYRQGLIDLPPYAWNHSVLHWWETATSRNFRFRKHPRTQLLGYLTPEGNSEELRWRNFLRLSESPWIEDHSVQNTLLYPAAGMMVMAIEAAAQMADENREVDGYELRDVVIGSALVVPSDEAGIETSVHVRPKRTGTQDTSYGWYEFSIFTRPGLEEWSRNATGLLKINYRRDGTKAEFFDEELFLKQKYRNTYRHIRAEADHHQTAEEFYEHQNEIGLQLGPTFRNFTALHRSGYQVAASLRIPDTASVMPHGFEHKHVVHPCTFDTIVQTILPAILAPGEELSVAAIPTYISRCYVSADMPATAGTTIETYGTADYVGVKDAEASVVASDPSWEKPLVIFEKIRGTRLSSMTNDVGAANSAHSRKVTGDIGWDYDVSLLCRKDMESLLALSRQASNQLDNDTIKELETAASIIMKRTISFVSKENVDATVPYLRQFYSAMEAIVSKLPVGNSSTASDEDLLDRVGARSVTGNLLVQLGRNLSSILQGHTPALQVLNSGLALEKFEAENPSALQAREIAASYYRMLAHKEPQSKILEIGGRAGHLTQSILEAAAGKGDATLQVSSYTFTDYDIKAVEEASKRFQAKRAYMEFKTFNPDFDPSTQGLQNGSYDFIVAENLTHATQSIDNALKHIKGLLKPEGVLLIAEISRPLLHLKLIMGAMPASWLNSDNGDQMCPTMTEQNWDDALREAGFNGVCASVSDSSDPQTGIGSVIISTATEAQVGAASSEITIIEPKNASDYVAALASKLATKLTSQGVSTHRSTFAKSTVQSFYGRSIIVLTDVEQSILYDVQDHDYDCLQKLLLEAKSSTWVTAGATVDCSKPQTALINGLARSVRAENATAAVAIVDLDSQVKFDANQNVDTILRIHTLCTRGAGQSCIDWEFAIRNNRVLIPRLKVESGVNELFAIQNNKLEPELAPFGEGNRALTLHVGTPGVLDSLYFDDDRSIEKELSENEVEIQVQASGLNFMDVMVAMGQIREPSIGLEVAGLVTRIGSAVTQFKAGDKVLTMLLGAFSTYVRNDVHLVKHIPNDMDFSTAASFPMIYSTAYSALVDQARLCKGEKVLIHAAAGGVGQAAIMLSQYIGAEIFATVSTQAKKELLMNRYGIPETHIFRSRDLSFAHGIKRLTDGYGVDVALNSLAGEALRETWHCMAWFGRFIELGKKDITINSGLDMSPFLRHVTYASVNVIGMIRQDPIRAGTLLDRAVSLLQKQQCRPVYPVKTMDYSEIEDAFRSLQTGTHMGKVVLAPTRDGKVLVTPRIESKARFSPDHTYVLSGGLGGLGRTLAQWMADHGAKNLAFLSRSGSTKPSAAQLIKDLEERSVKAVAYKCDITDAVAVAKAAEQCGRDLPPVKGVIQAAMVLNDAVFSNMDLQQFRNTVRPKVQGTWNLHESFGLKAGDGELDFFVMLSSSSGIIGNRGQGNYATGNAFQDAFAHFRRGMGLKATALDVGMVLGSGFVSEHEDIGAILKASGFVGLHENELLAMIQGAVSGVSTRGQLMPTQLVTGISTGGMVLQGGGELPWYLNDLALFKYFKIVDTHDLARDPAEQDAGLQVKLSQLKNVNDGIDAVVEAMKAKLAKWMSISQEDIDISQPVCTYGIDSLTAVELRGWVFRECQTDLSVFEIMANNPISVLAEQILKRSKAVSEGLINA